MLPLQILHAKRKLAERINMIFVDAEIEDVVLTNLALNPNNPLAFNMHKGKILGGLSELQRHIFDVDLATAILEVDRAVANLNELRKQHNILPVDALLMLPLTDESYARITAVRKARL